MNGLYEFKFFFLIIATVIVKTGGLIQLIITGMKTTPKKIFIVDDNRFFLESLVFPVSYTHLDVYKRQGQKSGSQHLF